jgi:nitrite reductase/ring-hydroxylating ferredoxin subunit
MQGRCYVSNAAVDEILRSVSDDAVLGDGAPTLPSECYTSSEFFKFETDFVFARSWICVGRVEQIPNRGDYLAPSVAGEPLLIVRGEDGKIRAMSAVCQHRGQVITCTPGSVPRFRCPLHFWTYDLAGNLLGVPRVEREELERYRKTVRLPVVRHEVWQGFIFVNLDPNATPLAPTLSKLDPCFENYPLGEMVCVPPIPFKDPVQWNWKIFFENYIDAYHTEFVHPDTQHKYAPTVLAGDGVEFTPMAPTDNAILRSVPLVETDGGMTADGWGPKPAFPIIESLSKRQRSRVFYVMIPPTMTLIFQPSMISYALVSAIGPEATGAASDRLMPGGWLLPKSTMGLGDFAERAKIFREGAGKLWAQDIPVNLSLQAGKRSRFSPDGIYVPSERTLSQFNLWLLDRYRSGSNAARASR